MLLAGSDRSVTVLDAAQSRVVRVIADAHARAAHTVRLPEPTAYSGLSQSAYDMFLTASTDNTVNMWDLRADACVMSFSSHTNRVHPVGVAFSPCMRYVACGSEDKHRG